MQSVWYLSTHLSCLSFQPKNMDILSMIWRSSHEVFMAPNGERKDIRANGCYLLNTLYSCFPWKSGLQNTRLLATGDFISKDLRRRWPWSALDRLEPATSQLSPEQVVKPESKPTQTFVVGCEDAYLAQQHELSRKSSLIICILAWAFFWTSESLWNLFTGSGIPSRN